MEWGSCAGPPTVIRISVAATSTEAPRVLACPGPYVVVGRSERCDLVLRAPGVSGTHCRLSRMDGIDGAYVLEDLGSTYGTHVNGTKIDRPVIVSAQDAIAVGGHSIRLVDDGTTGARKQPVASKSRPARGSVRVSEWQAHYERFDAAAQLWHGQGRPRSRLLRGSDLAVAEARQVGREPGFVRRIAEGDAPEERFVGRT